VGCYALLVLGRCTLSRFALINVWRFVSFLGMGFVVRFLFCRPLPMAAGWLGGGGGGCKKL
jgi:hypothetical protein